MLKLHTPRLFLRDHKMEDFSEYARLVCDSKTMYYLPDLICHDVEEAWESLSRAVEYAGARERQYYFLGIFHRENGKFIGDIGYTVEEHTPQGKLVSVGYFLLPEHQGKGYGSEALGELVRFAFQEDGVARISCGCLLENRPSWRAMEKAGLIREACLRKVQWHEDQLKDRLLYRLLREEWRPAGQ